MDQKKRRKKRRMGGGASTAACPPACCIVSLKAEVALFSRCQDAFFYSIFIFFKQQHNKVKLFVKSLLAFGSAEPKRRSTWLRRRLSTVGFSLSCQLGGRARPTSAPAVRCNASHNVKRDRKTKDEKCIFIPPSQTVCGGRTTVCEKRRA